MTNLLPRIEFAVQALYKTRRACPYCRSHATPVVARKHVVVKVRRCDDCSLCFTDPVYESSLFGSLYDAVYDAEGSTTDVPDRAEVEELLASGFAGSDKDFRERIATLRRIAPGDRLLELGSSWGYFLAQARTAGFVAQGIEIGRGRREYGVRELDVPIAESLGELGEHRFDLIYTAHVLEHFTDLTTIFDELFARLVPGGLLAAEVPHFDLAGRGAAALSNVGAVHPLGFTPRFFAENLPRHGFELEGFYDDWSDVPERPVAASTGSVVLLLARRPREG